MNTDSSQTGSASSTPPLSCPPSAVANGKNHCIELAIDEISRQLAMADRLKEYKTELEALLQKTKSASDEYTVAKRNELVKRWTEQDKKIAELIKTLTCTIQDWKSCIEDCVCPLFKEIADLDQELYGNCEPLPKPEAKCGLYRLRSWQLWDRDRKKRDYDINKAKLAAWEKPAQTIDKILTDNAKLLADAAKTLGQADVSSLIFDVFFKLVPMSWLIKPTDAQSQNDPAKYIVCSAVPDAWARLKQMIGELPQLIETNAYMLQFCDTLLPDYNAAKDAYASAEGDLKKTVDEIDRAEKALDEKKKSLERDAKTRLIADCAAASDKPGNGAKCPPGQGAGQPGQGGSTPGQSYAQPAAY